MCQPAKAPTTACASVVERQSAQTSLPSFRFPGVHARLRGSLRMLLQESHYPLDSGVRFSAQRPESLQPILSVRDGERGCNRVRQGTALAGDGQGLRVGGCLGGSRHRQGGVYGSVCRNQNGVRAERGSGTLRQASAFDEYAADPNVLYVQPNYIYHAVETLPNGRSTHMLGFSRKG
jgi:hypothetical protein